MIADTTVDRYYYVFDSREHRARVMDRRTGQEYTWEAAPRAQLITHVEKLRSTAVVRRFAQWCARQTGADDVASHTTAGRLWAAVRSSDRSAWTRIRRHTTEAVVLATALDLPGGHPEAARLLTIQACTHPEAKVAARDAAHMSERWAEFCAEGRPSAAAQIMRGRQVDWLLDLLGQRFSASEP